jgi:hypothetical protein
MAAVDVIPLDAPWSFSWYWPLLAVANTAIAAFFFWLYYTGEGKRP